MTAQRTPEAGFTLIETLVALAVLALSAVSLLGATEAHIVRIGSLETRAFAQWVAENHLAELTLGLTPEDTPPPMGGLAFKMQVTRTATADADLDQVEIVALAVSDGKAYSRLTGFLDTGLSNSGFPNSGADDKDPDL